MDSAETMTHVKPTNWITSCLSMFKQSLSPLLFLLFSCTIPFHYSFTPFPPPYNPPPPGYTDRLFLFLVGDYDYFLRIRFLPVSIPFWILTALIITQMFIPRLKSYDRDFAIHIVLGMLFTLLWWVFGNWMLFFSDYHTSWVKIPVILTPLLGIAFVAIHRALNWNSTDSRKE
ncbi:MAG: hypothetical protein RTU30_04255 [Candidatus Thorarchaeota archaeon]